MPATDQRVLFAGAVVTSALLLVSALAGHAELLVYATPLLVIAVPLLAGRYLGEETLARLRRRPSRPRHRRDLAVSGVRRTAVPFPRGGRLIAQALAERGPPAFASS